jgi:putative peptidoglycan lipid II flippase
VSIPSENESLLQPQKKMLIGAAGSVSAATLVSRVLGVGREIVMARYFGAGIYTDAFNTAYRIPNLLRDLFAEGALSAAFVPTFVRHLTEKGKEDAWRLANRVINALVVILGIVCLVIYFGARWFVYLLAAGYAATPGKVELTVQMTRIMSPFLLWIALAAVVMGMLNACGSFFAPAMASSVFNVCCILAGIFLSPYMPRFGLAPVVSMAIGALAGGIGQFAYQLPAARRRGYRYSLTLDFKDPGLRRIGALMLPAVIGLSATQINITVDNQLASMYGDGPVSYLNYAFRLMHLPVALFGIAIATVTMATVSHHAAHNAMDRLHATLDSSLRLAACLTFPATVGLILFRTEIVEFLYQSDRFLPADTVQTSRALLFYSLALFAYSAVKILVPAFYALNDTRTPVRNSVMAVGAKVGINLLLIMTPLGFLGLALATSLAAWLNLAFLLGSVRRKTGVRWSWGETAALARIALASLAMGALALASYHGAKHLLAVQGRLGLGLDLAVAITAASCALIPLLHFFRVGEAVELSGIVRRFFSRSSG